MASELFDSPFQGIVLRDIGCISSWSVKTRTLDIFRYRHKDIHVVSYASLFVVAFYLHYEPYLGIRWCFNNDINRKQRLHSNIQTIAHQFEFSIRRDKSDKSFVLEAA